MFFKGKCWFLISDIEYGKFENTKAPSFLCLFYTLSSILSMVFFFVFGWPTCIILVVEELGKIAVLVKFLFSKCNISEWLSWESKVSFLTAPWCSHLRSYCPEKCERIGIFIHRLVSPETCFSGEFGYMYGRMNKYSWRAWRYSRRL